MFYNWLVTDGFLTLHVFQYSEAAVENCSKFTEEHPCRSVILIKLQSSFIEITLRHGWNHTSALVFSCKFAAFFQKPVPKNTCGWLLQNIQDRQFFWVLQTCKFKPTTFYQVRLKATFYHHILAAIKKIKHVTSILFLYWKRRYRLRKYRLQRSHIHELIRNFWLKKSHIEYCSAPVYLAKLSENVCTVILKNGFSERRLVIF